jgi:hypothetical protein
VKTPAFEDVQTPAWTPRLREVPAAACITPRHSKRILCSPPAWTLQSYLVSHGSVAKLSESCWFVLLYVVSLPFKPFTRSGAHLSATTNWRLKKKRKKKREEEEENPS